MCGNGKNLPDRECMVQQDYEVDIEDAYEPDKVANHPGAGEGGGGEITLFVGTSIMYVAMVRSCQTESVWYNRITRPTKMLMNLTLLYSPIVKFLRKKRQRLVKKVSFDFFSSGFLLLYCVCVKGVLISGFLQPDVIYHVC